MPPTPEKWETRFDNEFTQVCENNDDGGHYEYLSLTTDNPNVFKEFIRQELHSQSSQLLSEVEAIISSNPQDFKDMTPGETKSLINKRLSLLRSKWEKTS